MALRVERLAQFNGPEDPDVGKRTLIAFALTLLLILVAQRFMSHPAPPPNPTPAAQQQAANAPAAAQPPAQPGSSSSSQNPVNAAPAAASAAPPASPGGAAKPTVTAESESETVVESDQFRVAFTNRGAQAKSWVLKKYNDDKGHPLELVHPIAAPRFGYPLSLWTFDAALRDRLNSALYQVSTSDSTSSDGKPQRTLRFQYADGSLQATKVFSFDLEKGGAKGQGAAAYVVRLEISVVQNGVPVAALVAWPSGFGDETVAASYSASVTLYEAGERNWIGRPVVERTPAAKVSGGGSTQSAMEFAGTSDQYFAAVLLPDVPQDSVMVTLRNPIAIPKNLDKPDPTQSVNVDVIGAAVGSRTGPTSGRFFVGPKAIEVLDRIHAISISGAPLGADLEPLVDFGKFFGWIAKPLFLWLEWTHDHLIFNWGWAIVILTILINAAMLPLRVSSMKSMMRMQKVKPQMDAIQAKYKKLKPTDPRRADMNKELGELYKREGVNPVGGCLPMLLQWPIWVGFYSMLGVAIELRHAPWFWVHDLASPDPYYLLPILTVVTMFLMQLMSPQPSGDPMQQKLMLIMMPLMFGWFSYRVASGLALYWVWSSVVGIAFQMWLNNTSFGKEMRAAAARQAARKK